jgi:ribosome modulation factor
MIPLPASGRDPRREGAEACASGAPREHCPYCDAEAAEWRAGWDEERALEGAPV